METLKNFESERILTIILNLRMLHMEASIIASNLELSRQEWKFTS